MADEIEMEAFVLPDDHGVYKCFPGKNYRFYKTMHDTSTVFLDIRGLEALPDNPAVWADADVLAVIAADRVAREIGRLATDALVKADSGPTIDKRNLTFLKGLLLNAKKGDILVVPGKGYRRDVLIGEILDEPGTFKRIEVTEKTGVHTYLGRSVTWRTSIEKRYVSPDLLEKLHTPSAFFALGESMRDEIYQLAYENFFYRGTFVSTFRTTKERFTSADNLVASIWFNGLAAVRNAAEINRLAGQIDTAELPEGNFVDIALLPTGAENENELELNINSPGTLAIRSASIFAFAAMALFPLDAAQAQSVADGDTRITIRAVGGGDDNCALRVEAAVAEYVRILGPENLLEACEFSKRSRDKATLKAKVHLKHHHIAPT